MAQAALMAAGPALNVAGAIHQGNSNAAISEYNAQMANRNAGIVQQQGAEQERRSRVQAGKQIGGMVSAYGASGVSSDGSAADVIRNSAANAELNALTIRNNADIKATALRNEASLDYYRANNDRVAGYMNAVATMIPGVGKIASSQGGPSASSDAMATDDSSDMWAGADSSAEAAGTSSAAEALA